MNCATAHYNKDSGYQEFDFNGKKSTQLETLIKVAYSLHEPAVDDRKNYVNLYRFDYVNIITPKKQWLNSYHTIRFIGYFLVGKEYKQGSIDFLVWPHNTFSHMLCHPTESLDIESSGTGTITLFIKGEEVIQFENNSTRIQRLVFANPNNEYNGQENTYLSDEINQKVINFSRVGIVSLVILGCKITGLWQNAYHVYNYPERTRKFY